MGFENTAGMGVNNFYGPRTTNSKFGGRIDDDVVKHASWVFNFDDLPRGTTGKLEMSLPAYAKILTARFEVLTGFTSTSTLTDLDVGLQQSDGTAISAGGLLPSTQLTQTAILSRGLFTVGTGVLVGASIGAAAGELVVTATAADLLSGKARVIVSYITEGV